MFGGADRYVGILMQLSDWTTSEKFATSLGDDPGTVERSLESLAHMGLVVEYPKALAMDFPSGDGLTTWNLIDLAMQRQSARGGFDPDKPHPDRPPRALKNTDHPRCLGTSNAAAQFKIRSVSSPSISSMTVSMGFKGTSWAR